MYPVPIRSNIYPYIYKYTGANMIIFKVRPLNPAKDVILRADINLSECDYKGNCQPYAFRFEQTLQAQNKELFDNGMENYFFRSQSRIPSTQQKHLKLINFSAHHDSDGQSLNLEFDSDKSIGTFNLFIEDADGYITFQEPQINLQNNRIFVRIKPTEQYKDADLNNAEYIITANLNEQILWHQTRVPNQNTALPQLQKNFSPSLLLTALLSGLLLNFMPCVFPLLIYYLLSLFYMHKQSANLIKKRLKTVIYGIFGAATLTLCFILINKYKNVPFGWGIQLQNMLFLIAMLFSGVLAVKLLPQIQSDVRYKLFLTERQTDIGIGMFCWLLTLSCGAPFLSEIVNTSYATSTISIFLSVFTITLGLCLPLFLIIKLQTPQTLIIWLNRHRASFSVLSKFALGTALLWYIWLIAEQTSAVFAVKVLLFLALFFYIIGIGIKFLQYLTGIFDEKITPAFLQKLRYGTYILICLIFVIFAAAVGWRAQINQMKTRALKATSFVQNIDESLIQADIKQGYSVLVAIGANWCFTCRLNNFLIFNQPNLHKWAQRDKLKFISADISNYNQNIIEYMHKFSTHLDLPFYILYTPIIRNGIILPSTPDLGDIDRLLLYNKSL